MNILITGAGNGIGFALVSLLSLNKENRVIAASRNTTSLQVLAGNAPNVIPFQCDITIATQRDSLVAFVKQHANTLHILINNAGQLINKPFEALDADDYTQMFAVNSIAPALLIKDLLPSLLNSTPQHKSHVVNIASMGGFQGSIKFPGLSAYSMSKAAVANLTECLAAEYADKAIAFNALALGAVDTPMLEKAFPDYKAGLLPEDMAAFVADFAINGAKYFNGKLLPVSSSTP